MPGLLARVARVARAGLVGACLSAGAGPALAQDATVAPSTTPVLIVDRERLFASSAFGLASLAREEEAAKALEAENARIQAELVAEEQELTLLRKTLSAEDFAARAKAFDEKVVRIRAEQDTKARDLAAARDEDGRAFGAAIAPILGEILNDHGAVVMLDKGLVILSLSAIDVTDEAIAKADKVLNLPVEPSP